MQNPKLNNSGKSQNIGEQSNLSLRERAALAWKDARPLREAERIKQQAKSLEQFSIELTRLFGTDYDVKVGISPEGKITATIEGLTFQRESLGFGVVIITLVETCPRCRKKVPSFPLNNPADLGEAIEKFEEVLNTGGALMDHNCVAIPEKEKHELPSAQQRFD